MNAAKSLPSNGNGKAGVLVRSGAFGSFEKRQRASKKPVRTRYACPSARAVQVALAAKDPGRHPATYHGFAHQGVDAGLQASPRGSECLDGGGVQSQRYLCFAATAQRATRSFHGGNFVGAGFVGVKVLSDASGNGGILDRRGQSQHAALLEGGLCPVGSHSGGVVGVSYGSCARSASMGASWAALRLTRSQSVPASGMCSLTPFSSDMFTSTFARQLGP
jgi:hypothetical protein